MASDFQKAWMAGVERVSAWADLLDRINVFPVADGDTGRNLVVSLAPLRRLDQERSKMVTALLLSARGNSGNIAFPDRIHQGGFHGDPLDGGRTGLSAGTAGDP